MENSNARRREVENSDKQGECNIVHWQLGERRVHGEQAEHLVFSTYACRTGRTWSAVELPKKGQFGSRAVLCLEVVLCWRVHPFCSL